MGEAAIEADNVWKTFRVFSEKSSTLKQAVLRRGGEVFQEFWALRDVSFEVPAGTSFALVGGNGAGKSTMLKTLARILEPDKGSVRCRGKVSALLELGAGFHPELTGEENVYLSGAILGMSRSTVASRFDEIVAFSGLESAVRNPVKTYSSGMFARLAFAVAVSVEPDILLVDEVLAVGDEQFQRRCTERMAELRSDGRTVVIVSHSLGQLQQMCDRAVWLDHGVVAAEGETLDVIERYLASVSASYRIDDRGRPRAGTGEVTIEATVTSPEQDMLRTGAPAVVQVRWTADELVRDVNFVFSVRAADGTMIASTASAAEVPYDEVSGSGSLDYAIDSLPLLPGSYVLAAAACGRHSGHVFDESSEMARFDVAPPDRFTGDGGKVTLGGRWTRGDSS
jgi:ABC-2 type transport system ATP-binding protein